MTLGLLVAPVVGFIVGGVWLLSAIGVALMAADLLSAGAKVFAVSCVLFLPLGLIGLLGMRRLLDARVGEELGDVSGQWRIEFRTDPKYANRSIGAGWLLLALAVAQIIAFHRSGALLALALTFLAVGYQRERYCLLVIREDHLELWHGSTSPRQWLHLSDIDAINVVSPVRAELITHAGPRYALPMRRLSPSDRERLLQELQWRIDRANPPPPPSSFGY